MFILVRYTAISPFPKTCPDAYIVAQEFTARKLMCDVVINVVVDGLDSGEEETKVE